MTSLQNEFFYSSKKEEVERFLTEIHTLIKNCPLLTNRSLFYLKKMCEEESICICTDKRNLCGFIIREKIAKDLFELKSLYVKNKYRDKGLGSILIHKNCVQKEKESYFAFTTVPQIKNLLFKNGFIKNDLKKTKISFLLKIILSRDILSLISYDSKEMEFYLKSSHA